VYPCDIQVYQAARDVSASHDTLASLFEGIQQFLNRLDIYTRVSLSRAMVEFIVTRLVQLLQVLGLVTKEIKQNPLSKYNLSDMNMISN
jgi:hypothetical protein